MLKHAAPLHAAGWRVARRPPHPLPRAADRRACLLFVSRQAKEFAPDMIFEQEPSQLLNAILPLYLNGQMLRTLQESVASELASRMTAMQAATDNAKDLQGRLEQEMNRARQAKITQELMEIIAGADATN